ncbi:MAG: SET domain-containing protein [Candidatus Acidiferrales bacterium]
MLASSYISPKARKGRKSGIAGRGLFAVHPIRKGEIVAIKGGHIIDRKSLRRRIRSIGDSYIQIDDNFFLAPLEKREYGGVMMFLNHSCDPNVGVRGEITFVAMRSIAPGEELTVDYATIDDDSFRMKCRCGSANCRGIVTGKDWMRSELQKKYGSYFSAFLLEKIRK